MEPSYARALLLDQHDELRRLFGTIQQLADRALAGEDVANELSEQLTELRRRFAEHNHSEEQLLEPILERDPAWGPARVKRMLEEHAAEHVSFRASLEGPVHEVAARMADLVEEMDAHMAAEERTFLSVGVLRDGHVTPNAGH